MKSFLLLSLFISHITFAQSSNKDILTIASQDIPPYYFEKSPKKVDGFFYKVIRNVCTRAKIECEYKVYPFRRVQQYLSQGDVHICAPMALTPEREKEMNFSKIIYSSGYQFFGKKEVIDNIKNIRLISGNIGAHSPSSTYSALLNTQKDFNLNIEIKQETDVEMVFDKLKKGRYDLVFMNKDISKKWASTNNSKEITFKSYERYISPIDYRIAYTKKELSTDQMKLLQKFKLELSSYLKTKEFKKLTESL